MELNGNLVLEVVAHATEVVAHANCCELCFGGKKRRVGARGRARVGVSGCFGVGVRARMRRNI